MKSPLHILHLEDNNNDAQLVQGTLEAEELKCVITRVQNRADFIAALEPGDVDLVLADFSLPGFDGQEALQIVRQKCPQLPFMFLSGTLGEEQAIDALKSGATDYVLKGRLSRLAPAVRRAMQEVEVQMERQQMELQLVEAQKMEVLGQLASGVAHDFNNILGVILGYHDLLRLELTPDTTAYNYAEQIRHAADRAVALTRQLLVFGRKETANPAVMDLNKAVEEMEKMLRRLIGENIILTILPGGEPGWVRADTGHIGQVLMNLVVNARDAMPQGGKLTIATRNVIVDDAPALAHEEVPPGDYVELTVEDTGTGMTDEVKARLFEAFFTTKPKGKGTGLGLATCHTIIEQCNGYICVESELGKGTTFRVYLPRVATPAEGGIEPPATPPSLGGAETLLLVEDEPPLRHLASSILEGQGYMVLRANNGQDGLNVARNHTGQVIDLVITDVVMPQMGGKMMAEWLKITNPGIKILFTSGYTDEVLSDPESMDPSIAFLAKPYTPAMLTRKVREMLDAPPSPPESVIP